MCMCVHISYLQATRTVRHCYRWAWFADVRNVSHTKHTRTNVLGFLVSLVSPPLPPPKRTHTHTQKLICQFCTRAYHQYVMRPYTIRMIIYSIQCANMSLQNSILHGIYFMLLLCCCCCTFSYFTKILISSAAFQFRQPKFVIWNIYVCFVYTPHFQNSKVGLSHRKVRTQIKVQVVMVHDNIILEFLVL